MLSLPERPTSTRCDSIKFYQLLLVFCSLGLTVHGFQVQMPRVTKTKATSSLGRHLGRMPTINQQNVCIRPLNIMSRSSKVVDVEFERSPEPEERGGQNSTTATSPKSKTKKKKPNSKKKPSTDTTAEGKSLFELSLESDPQWKEVRIPFVDNQHGTVIDGTLAFCVELEGISYGIAVPCDHAAAITVEDTDGSVMNMYPDLEENEEIMEIMAAQLVENVGADLSLKRTPRVLTIEGDLDQYTKNWEEEILPKPNAVEELMDDSDEDLQFFHDFMKKELGEEEYEKTMAEPVTAEDIGDELMELFDIPGFGTRKDDVAGVEAMMKSLLDEEDPSEGMEEALGGDILDHEGAALKLISYNFKNGKSYSLVQLLKPYTLVGRLNKEVTENEGIQFDLLSPEEEKIIIPKLEELCRKDLEASGLSLAP